MSELFDSVREGNTLLRDVNDTSVQKSVLIHDETLRDGEQTPGVSFSPEQKIELANRIIGFGVDSMNLGFPVVSEIEKETIQAIAKQHGGGQVRLSCLCRAKKSDVEVIAKCGVDTAAVFVGLSDVHLEKKYDLSVEAALERVVNNIKEAKDHGLNVRVGFEDSSRAPLDRMKKATEMALEAGAYIVGLCDTNGILTPITTQRVVTELVKITGDDGLFVHFHNDLGMATANTLTAVVSGAKMVQGTLAGLGERAGNVRLEEIVVALQTKYQLAEHIDIKKVIETSELAREYASFPDALNSPVTGRNTFAHESGIHVHGIARDPATYEPYPPKLVGREHKFRFGKHAGTSNILAVGKALGLTPTAEQAANVLREVKRMGDAQIPVSEDNVASLLRIACQ